MTTTRTALYRFFDAEGHLLYVGITKDTKARWAAHARDRATTWWPSVANKTVEWFDSRVEASGAEIAAIASENPRYNLARTSSPMLMSDSGGVRLSSEDWSQFEWITMSDLARRVVARGIAKSLSRQRVKQLMESDPAWPIPRDQMRFIANMWVLPWEVMEPYFRTRKTRQGARTDLAEKAKPQRGLATHQAARDRYGDEPFSTLDLMELTGLSNAGVQQHVKALLSAGLLKVAGRAPRQGSARIGHRLLVALPARDEQSGGAA